MGVGIYVNLLFVIYFLYSFGYCFGYFQWNVQPKTIVCAGDDAHLVWNYTTNETASIFVWQKLGSQNTLVARIFGGTFSVTTSYTGRVTQSYLGNAAIAISSVNTSDSGTYGCTIQTVNSANVMLIVAEQPSGIPYFNKTDNSLTCNPPQKLGSPPVETKLKLLPGGTVSSTLTTTNHGTYQCCISGEAVRCLASLDSTVTEFCVNETLDLEYTTTTSQTTTELFTTSTEPQTSPQPKTTDSVTTNTEAKTTRSYSETTTKAITSNVPEGGQTTTELTTTPEAASSSGSTTTVYTSTTNPSGSPLIGEEIVIIIVCSVVGFIIILFIVIIVMFVIYKRRKNPIEKHHKQEHTNELYKQQEKTFDDIHAWVNWNKYDIRRVKERHIAQYEYPNKKKITTHSYTTYQRPRRYDYNKYNNTNTISTYYPRNYGESHNYGFERETSPYEQTYQYDTGNTHGSSYYDQQKHQEKRLGGHHHRSSGGHHHERSSERHHGRYQRTNYQSYPAASYYYYPKDQY